MSCSFPSEDIEALVRDELADADAAKVAAHIADCASCAEEEDWLRAEMAAFEARRDEAPGADDLWAGVESAIAGDLATTAPAASPRSRTLIAFSSGFVAAAAAAAALFVFAGPTTTTSPRVITKVIERSTPVANKSAVVRVAGMADMDTAEKQYVDALQRLRTEYRNRHGSDSPALVRTYEKDMNDNLQRLRAARLAAGDDLDGRVRVLDAYSTYVRTLQSAAEGMDI